MTSDLNISDHNRVPGPHDSTYNQIETLDLQNLLIGDDASAFPCLTVIYHPQLERIGEQAIIGSLMAHTPVELSRNTPEFSHPGSALVQPLRDPFLSRKPITLTRIDEDTVSIELKHRGHLQVGSQRIETFIDVSIDDLKTKGVFLTLSRRVMLLFHMVTLRERAPYPGIVGEGDGIRHVRRQIAQVADLEVPVLIRGETGVGKELVAKCIHRNSRRSNGPYNIINMATIQEGTAASILFGHVRGAFTGADSRKSGLFQEADGGTLFMDEIGDTPTQIQSMLLRALSERKILPMGEAKELSVDVRIIAATDINIEEGAQDGTFRAALLHRLSGYEIRVPPLRERREDIPRLAVHFLTKVLREIGEENRLRPPEAERKLWFPPTLMLMLYHHDWSGNVRQLSNTISQLVISNRGEPKLRVGANTKRILQQDQGQRQPENKPQPQPKPKPSAKSNPSSKKHKVTNQDIYEALESCNWQVGPAADLLGMPRSTLYGRMERHQDIRKAGDLTRVELQAELDKARGDVDKVVMRLKVSPRGLKMRIKALNIDPDTFK